MPNKDKDSKTTITKIFVCKDCGARYKNESNFNQHFNTNSHKLKVKGKPKQERIVPKKKASDEKKIDFGHNVKTYQGNNSKSNITMISNPFEILGDLYD